MLNWIVIGSGDVVNRLVKNSLNTKSSKVSYVFSKDYNQSKKIAKKYNYGSAIRDIGIALKDKKINCAYIATPPNDHFYYINLLAKNKINILCEKPLVLKKNDLKKIKSICTKNKVSFYGSFYRREQERFKYVKKLLNKNLVGNPIAFDYKMHHSLETHPTAPIFKSMKKKKIPWRFSQKVSGGGNFLDMGLHVLDFLMDIFGNIEKYQYIKNKSKKYYDVEESFILNLMFKNGIIGQGSWHSTISKKEDIMNIYGTKGTIEFSFNFNNKVILRIGNKTIIKNIKFITPPNKPIIKKVIKIFKNSIKTKKNFIDDESLNLTLFQTKMF